MISEKKISTTFYLLTFVLLAGLFFPAVVRHGMFLDGITYGAISNNMAHGLGSLWNPHYTKTLYPAFHEHPPLVFFIQHYFFRLFGDSFLTERIYCLFTLILSTTGIILIFKEIYRGQVKHGWLPILLWISVPIVLWTYRNNLLESTMSIFTTYSILFLLKSLKNKKILLLLPAGIFILLAFLSKGFVGIFPLVVPLLYLIVYKEYKTGILQFLILLFITLGSALLLFEVEPDAKVNILAYFERQLLPSLNLDHEFSEKPRVNILKDLIFQLIIPLAFFIFIMVREFVKTRKIKSIKNREALLMLLIGLSGSVPLVVTLKQRMFYLLPSMPYFVLAIGIITIPQTVGLIKKLSPGWIKGIQIAGYSGIAVVLFLTIFSFGKYAKNEALINDVMTICNTVERGEVISCSKSLWTEYKLVALLSRKGYVSLDFKHKNTYHILKNNEQVTDEFSSTYREVPLAINGYHLYKRR